ncbi:metal ABC transporter substrate-binding protein [Candidatus Xianfuyuplasma coldseepsis]|uniref:Zinc ABC transporter solute-binding protein n=1 Tax=Candidatus Xianfuyuplasma coldseepsis TaxID=2782163 RepID=A0A7L7KQD0_9MOLU|nr:zinc ABC transporter substrate-binding protein [Xianfuyuplasma coldseepsis]QMS85001.1 zinc ABC transporter solute-binding protein [Xianfuyuplasma coldseepsis]
MKKLLLLVGILVMSLSLAACKGTEDDDRPKIYVTVYPMEFLIEEIAGDTVNVIQVPGASSHSDSIDWSAREIIDMINSDLLFYIHGGADDYIPDNADVFDDGDVELIDMSQHIEYNEVCYTHTHEEHEEEQTENPVDETCDANMISDDPHFWIDPVRMAEAALFVKDKLIATYPENEELYNNNYNVLNSALEKLDLDYQEMADNATKPIITTVMLFSYWHDRYDIEIISITTDAHSSETNPGELIEVLEIAQEHNVEYILFEKNANSPAGTQLLSDLQTTAPEAAALYLHGLGQITDDERDNGSTYLTLMIDNLTALNSATK